MNVRMAVAALILALATPAWGAKQMYRWVDKNGKVHYGDTIPAEYAKQGSATMSKSGRVVKETAAASTPEQIRAKEEAEKKEQEEKKKEEDQKRKDKALLASYTTVGEIDLAEKRNLEALDVQIKSFELRLRSAEGRRDNLKKQEQGFASRGKPVPEDVTAGVKAADAEVLHLKGSVGDLNRDRDAMKARFAADRARYLELKGGSRPAK